PYLGDDTRSPGCSVFDDPIWKMFPSGSIPSHVPHGRWTMVTPSDSSLLHSDATSSTSNISFTGGFSRVAGEVKLSQFDRQSPEELHAKRTWSLQHRIPATCPEVFRQYASTRGSRRKMLPCDEGLSRRATLWSNA